MKRPTNKRIALAFPQGLAFLDRLVTGVVAYAKSRGAWTFTCAPEIVDPSIRWLKDWPGDGAFVFVRTAAEARLARKLRIPVVNLASWLPKSGIPSVSVDHEAIGRTAAQYFLRKHFQRLGYYGTDGQSFSMLRRRGFESAARDAGRECSTLLVGSPDDTYQRWTDQQGEIESWLETLRPPVGVLGSTDLRARMVLEACSALGLRVPEEVAVLGVDNDSIACEFSQPALSSISRSDQQVGYKAAALLDDLMKGRAAPAGPILVPPGEVVQRRSTETLAIEDPQVAAAVHYIHEHGAECFGVKQVLGKVSLSRRALERRFQECLGCTPHEFINQARVDRAKKLLSAPERLTLSAIAEASGFSDLRRFRIVFRRLEGVTPAQFRQSAATSGDGSSR